MYKIRLVFLITLSSLFLNCKAFEFDCKNDVEEYQWDAYIQAIQAAAPFLNQGQALVVFGYLDREPNDTVSAGFMPFSILTFDGHLYTRVPASQVTSPCRKCTRDNTYITHECINPSLKNHAKDSRMFNLNEYLDCFITESKEDIINKPFGTTPPYYHIIREYFYALINEKGIVHGATVLPIIMKPPFAEEYLGTMQVHMMFNLMWDLQTKQLRPELFNRYNRAY